MALTANIKVLTDRCNQIEYDTVLKTLQATKKQISQLEANVKEKAYQIAKLQDIDNEKDCTIDAMQQYLRRDCIKMTGIPSLPLDNPKLLVLELGSPISTIPTIDFSDHLPIFYIVGIPVQKQKLKRCYRDYRLFDYELHLQDIEAIDWNAVFSESNDLNESAAKPINILQLIC